MTPLRQQMIDVMTLKGLRDVFETALAHERDVTRRFNVIAAMAAEKAKKQQASQSRSAQSLT